MPIQSAHAQWSKDGLVATRQSAWALAVTPDNEGGFWALFVYEKSSLDRYYIQRFDSRGYRQFGPDGIPIAPDSLTTQYAPYTLCGPFGTGVMTSNGDLLVAYEAFGPNGYVAAYLQKFSPSGERLYDGLGIFVANPSFHLASHNFAFPGFAVSDGNDGIWFLVGRHLATRFYLLGVNHDGSVKIGLKDLGDSDTIRERGMCSDGSGGVFIYFSRPDEYKRTIHWRHVMANGRFQYQDPKTAFAAPSIYIAFLVFPDSSGGSYCSYMIAGESLGMQRMSQDGVPLWGENGLYYSGTNLFLSYPLAMLSDGTYAFAVTQRHNSDFLQVGIVSLEGSYIHYPADNNLGYVYDHYPGLNMNIAPISNSPDFFIVEPRQEGPYNESIKYVVMHRITDQGTRDLWHDSPLIIFREKDGFNLLDNYLYNLADSSILVRVDEFSNEYGYFSLFYKILYDGTILDTTLEAVFPTSPAEPDGFTIDSARPNPLNGTVTIRITVPGNSLATLTFYDLTGRAVGTLKVPASTAGTATVIWRPEQTLASGVYFVRAQSSAGQVSTKKLVLLR